MLCRTLPLLLLGYVISAESTERLPDPAQVNEKVATAMVRTGAKGLALAVIEDGEVAYVQAYGIRNAAGDPLQTNTVMYGASLTKTVMAYATLQLADRGLLDLDRSVGTYLANPLPDYPKEPKYADWSGLKEDLRWRKIPPRICLTH